MQTKVSFIFHSLTGETEAGQGFPLPWNTCYHHCAYEVRTNRGKSCGGTCHGLTCTCLYGSACRRGRRSLYLDTAQSEEND